MIVLLIGLLVSPASPAAADAGPGFRQNHYYTPGQVWSLQYNMKGKCGDTSSCVNNASRNGVYNDLYGQWLVGHSLAVATMEEMCSDQLFWVAVSLNAAGITGYGSGFYTARHFGISGCADYGDGVFALGSKTADANKQFVSQPGGVEQRGAACIRTSFFIPYTACAFHLAASNVDVAANQLNELISHTATLDAYRAVGGDANLSPDDTRTTGGGRILNAMTSAGYGEVDGSPTCTNYASCPQKETFTIQCLISIACETKKIDYTFVKGFSPVPRSDVYATPSESDHSAVYGYILASPSSTNIQLRARNSGKCLDVAGASSADGAVIQQWGCIGPSQTNQLWDLVVVDQAWFQIRSRSSGKCVDIINAGTGDGVSTQQFTCVLVPQQEFRLVPLGDGYQIVARHDSKCLDVRGPSTANGAVIQQWTCVGASQENQLWTSTTP